MLESPTLEILINQIQNNHKDFSAKYQMLTHTIEQRIVNLQNSELWENVIHRRSPHDFQAYIEKFNHIRNFNNQLIRIQQEELTSLRQYFTDNTGEFIAHHKDGQNDALIISGQDAKRLFEVAEYQLKLNHAKQQALFANCFNNELSYIKDVWDQAEEITAAAVMQTITQPQNTKNLLKNPKKNWNYHTNPNYPDDIRNIIHAGKAYQQIAHSCADTSIPDKNAKDTKGEPKTQSLYGYNLNIKGDALISVRRALNPKTYWDSNASNKDNFIINMSKIDKDNKFVARCYPHPKWNSKTTLAAYKLFVLECKAQNLKNFRGIWDEKNLSSKDKIALIEYIRKVYGPEATIENEWKLKEHHAEHLCNPLFQEALHQKFLKEDKVFGIERGKIGPKLPVHMPQPMTAPSLDEIVPPAGIPPVGPTKLQAKVIRNGPRSAKDNLAGAAKIVPSQEDHPLAVNNPNNSSLPNP